MKTMKIMTVAILVLMIAAVPATAGKKNKCTTIKSGELLASDGSVLTVGYNEWGYNYQARKFNGMWCDYHPYYRPGGPGHEWCIENYGDVALGMKWNDAWLSNKDCDDDGLLDRYYGHSSYIGSGAWLTNHENGYYEGGDGETCHFTYFVKIVAAPSTAVVDNGVWYAEDGIEIGPEIWGAFAIIQEVWNDPCAGVSGLQYKSQASPGLGGWGF